MNNSLTTLKTNQLTKKIVLECLIKIKVDHSIEISQNDLDIKVNLLYEDCKYQPAELFIIQSETLRKGKLFGKLPANHEFYCKYKMPNEVIFANKVIGSLAIKDFRKLDDGSIDIYCFDGCSKILANLPQEKKEQIRTIFNNKMLNLA